MTSPFGTAYQLRVEVQRLERLLQENTRQLQRYASMTADTAVADSINQLVNVRCAAFSLATGVTALVMRTELNNLIHLGASGVVFPFDVVLAGMAVDASHSHGSDPGNWTFTAEQRTAAGVLVASNSLTMSMATTGYGNHNISRVWAPSSPITLTAGTHVLLTTCSGPACNGPFVTANMLFRRTS